MLIDGSIVDKVTGSIIPNCEIVRYLNNIVIGSPILVSDGNFSGLDVSLDQNLSFLFSSPGYASAYANSVDILSSGSNNYNVFLEPENGKVNTALLGAGILTLILLSSKKKAVGEIDVKKYTPYLLIGGVLVVGGVVKKILEKFGLITPAAVTKPSTDPTSYWNPLFYTHYNDYTKAINTQQATVLANNIYSAFTPIGYYIEDITAAIHSLQTQCEVSFLAKIFNDIYGKDLYQFLINGWWPGDHISNDEAVQLNAFISNLPTN